MSRAGPFTFYEFFAGGGMARVGLGEAWQCVFANDFDPVKGAAYRANFGDDDLHQGDVWALSAAELPGREGARLMGLPDSYVLPTRTTAALHVVGDGVAVPVVRWLAEHLLEPLLAPAAVMAAE